MNIHENIDNAIDNSSTIIKINVIDLNNISKTLKGKIIAFSGNINGLSTEQLDKIQRISINKDSSITKQGRFGHGYPISRSIFTNNIGKVKWLTCHSEIDCKYKNIFESNSFYI